MEITGDLIIKEAINPGFAAFDTYALEISRFQYMNNSIYRRFCDAIKKDPSSVTTTTGIPFLPIQFFKSHDVLSTNSEPELIFESSGTSGSVNSRHLVSDLKLYKKSFLAAFEIFFGNPDGYCILGLLPSYLERGNSSLVYMVNELVNKSGNSDSGFYLYDHEKLANLLVKNEAENIPTILFGVTYALLDFALAYPLNLKLTLIIETGGMKGRKKELTRNEVHTVLKSQLGLSAIYSEYGMTELLSQAYTTGQELFTSPPWMKVYLRAEDDPFDIKCSAEVQAKPKTGVVNIIDLANINSCSFIATDDYGKLYPDGSFEIMGRLDNSDVRGCGLMIV